MVRFRILLNAFPCYKPVTKQYPGSKRKAGSLGSAKVLSLFAVLLFLPQIVFPIEQALDTPIQLESEEASEDLFPLHAEVYPSRDVLKLDISEKISERDRYDLLRFYADSPFLETREASTDHARSRAWPIILSVLAPGAGEIYMGYYKRGAILLAAEIGAWTGYAYFHNKGIDSREAYQRFADEHWLIDKWLCDHPDGSGCGMTIAELDSIGQEYSGIKEHWPGYMPFVSKAEDRQHYYENIGKYDWFISGWEDWDPGSKPRETAMRDTYRSMRKDSNDQLDTAKRFIYMSLAARAFSIIETIYLSRSSKGGHPDGSSEVGKGFHLTVTPRGIHSTEIALERSF